MLNAVQNSFVKFHGNAYGFIRKTLKAEEVVLELTFLEFSFSSVQEYVKYFLRKGRKKERNFKITYCTPHHNKDK